MDDRNYYRKLDDQELLDLSKHVSTAELSVVLAERLRKATDKLDTLLSDDDY
jgi:hypothetical protein